MAAQLDAKARRELAREARGLKVLLQVGRAGVTEAVVGQARQLLGTHKLVKVRVAGADREEAEAVAADLAGRAGAELVGLTGYVAVLYCAESEGSLKP